MNKSIMKKKDFDGRSLDHATLEYIRIQTVKTVNKGMPARQVGEIFGVHHSRVYEWVKKAAKRGMDSLRAKPVPGRQSFLNEQQKKVLTLWLCIFTPLDFEFEVILWTTEIIKMLIEKKFSIILSRSAVNRLLHRLGLTPQRPRYRAIERNAAAVEKWIKEEFREIKELAKKEGAKIYFLDEAGVRTDYHAGTTWSLAGLTPIVPATGKRYRINLIAAITSEGELHFQVGTQSLNGKVFVEYLKEMVKEASHPVWIIMDGYSAHHSKVVNEYLETTNGMVKIFFLPTYSPLLNPVELLWNNIKAQGMARYLMRSLEELKTKTAQLLESLKGMPEKIQAFFREESVRYAL